MTIYDAITGEKVGFVRSITPYLLNNIKHYQAVRIEEESLKVWERETAESARRELMARSLVNELEEGE